MSKTDPKYAKRMLCKVISDRLSRLTLQLNPALAVHCTSTKKATWIPRKCGDILLQIGSIVWNAPAVFISGMINITVTYVVYDARFNSMHWEYV